MIDKNYNYAIVGASTNKDKYGYKVFKDLKESGYKVFAVNPKRGKLLDLKIYKNLSEIKEKIDVAVFITQPEVTLKVLEEVKRLDIKNAWMQPGSESKEAINFCKNNKISLIHNSCIMMEKNK